METGKLKLALSAGAVALSMALAGCGGGSSSGPVAASGGGSQQERPPEPPTPFQTARAAIAAASTVEAVLDARDGADVTADDADTLRGLASARIVALVTAQIAEAASDEDAQGFLTEEVTDEISGTQTATLEAAIQSRIAALAAMAEVDRQKMALMTAADAVDTSDLEGQDAIDAAQRTVDGLQTALTNAVNVSDEDKAQYQTALMTAQQAVADARSDLNRRTRLATATSSVGAVKTALDALPRDETATPAQETAVSEAITKAQADIDAAEDAGADITDAQRNLDGYEGEFKDRQITIADAREEAKKARIAEEQATAQAAAKARTARAKALRAALETNIASLSTEPSRPAAGNPSIYYVNDTDRSIMILGADVDDDATIRLRKTDDTVPSLGDWKGTHYAGGAGMQRVYSDRDAPEMVDFDEAPDGVREGLGTQVSDAGSLQGTFPIQISADPPVYREHIASDMFSKSGTTTHAGSTAGFDGTYKGVGGKFICSGSTACTSQYDEDTGNIILVGTWNFDPVEGAKLPVEKDGTYLQFGWWRLADSAIRVFADNTGYTFADVGNSSSLVTGTATYEGKAAGLFAVSGDLRSTVADRSGSFTADARLDAEFAGADSTLTGTINNFTLDDDGPTQGPSVRVQVWHGADMVLVSS